MSITQPSAIEAIRAFRKSDALVARYVATAPNPYAPEGKPSNIDIYEDDKDLEYWLSGPKLIQIGPRAGIRVGSDYEGGQSLDVAELRSLADGIIAGQIDDWATRKASLIPYEDNRRGQVYFFRREIMESVGENDLPPFVQVGLYTDGTLACFTNTLP